MPGNAGTGRRNTGSGSSGRRNSQNRAGNTDRGHRQPQSGNSGRSRQKTGRGMTRQQRQKQLMTHVLIAAAVILAAIIVVVFSVRAGSRAEKNPEAAAGTEVSQTAAAAENTGTDAVSESVGTPQTAAEESGADTLADDADSENAAVEQESDTVKSDAVQGTVTAAGNTNAARTESSAEEEVPSGPGMADQSLVEKLSVEAKKNLETEKIRLEKEEEERQRLAEEEAKRNEVRDRDELSEISIEELAEYLRNKEVPEELVEFMEEYPEAREFVTDYLYQPDPPLSKDISGEVQKGVFPHFLQWDERWGYEDYGGSFFAVAGCGPTAMSVVYSGLTGKSDMNPYKMSQWAEEQGYYIVGEGTSWEMMWSGANKLGLYWWEVDFDETSIRAALDSGCPIIAAMSPGGDFTTFGHFIVMTDIDAEGNITIRDSNSIERSERTWTWDELMWQTAAMWAYNYDDGVYDEEVY